MDAFVEKIETIAKRDYHGDFAKAAEKYCVEHPAEYVRYKRENYLSVGRIIQKTVLSEPQVRAQVEYQAEHLAARTGLDLAVS